MSKLRGFGFTFDAGSGVTRNWYIDGEGAKRWADNDQVVSGLSGQHGDQENANTLSAELARVSGV